ncbi:Rha family transcriptional regulator [Lactobacillus amylovorus]|uniref:Rha family transcriptional regulator n=1 Tax=Lactobacillus amylovorus TaxID=1604 RepID=UPI00232D7A1B|nr:Rha family transcriptional regulator [Lactobacillus amylovorus]MDB6269054.1 Rha family transcriptional regulator [Lactobacillus amylovorus]
MNELVVMKNQQAVTTSLKVAEVFSKAHRDVLKAIRNLTAQNCTVGNMFDEGTYINKQGHEQPMYFMNRDGFTLLAMGFTGDKALQFKVKYIEAFNKMEQVIKSEALPQTTDEQIELVYKSLVEKNKEIEHTNKRVDKVEKDIQQIKDTAEVDEQERYQLLQARKARVIRACGGENSNYYQEKKAKKVFAEFGRDFKKAFQIPRYDCLKKKLFDEAIDFTKKWYPSFVLQREIQNVNAQTRLDLGDD